MKNYKKEEVLAYQMLQIPGVGGKSLMKLMQYAGSLESTLEMSEDEIRGCISAKTANAFIQGRNKKIKGTPESLKKEKDISFIPFFSEQFPAKLRNIPDPPFAIFIKGEVPTAEKPSVAVIGARACSEYGKKIAYEFGKILSLHNVQIISGMARGIDGIAQKAALDEGGVTYGVLGCGVDVCYPPENQELYQGIVKQGGLLSEYLPGTLAQSTLFPQRNRIISGLADLILVIEARKRSGTYITVTQALEQGKEVYAVPGRITDALSEGCNFLLSQGAGIATNPEDILQALNWKGTSVDCLKKTPESGICDRKDEMTKTILSELDFVPKDINTVYYNVRLKYNVTMDELILKLLKMQAEGLVKSMGSYYCLTTTL